MNTLSLPLYMVDTSHGALVFSSGPEGRERLMSFLQKLTDEYYLLDAEKGPVQVYITNTDHVPAELIALANKKEYQTVKPDPEIWELVDEFTMRPTSEDFIILAERTGSSINSYNNNVWRLIELKTRAFNRSTALNPSFAHADAFRELVEQLDHRMNTPDPNRPHELSDSLAQIRQLADRILNTSYGNVRGHQNLARTFRETDQAGEKVPCVAIETAYGLLFYAQSAEGQQMQQLFLQELTDHYFDSAFDFGPVRIYDMTDTPATLRTRLNLTDTIQGNPPYQSIERLSEQDRHGMVLRFESDMAPTALSFFLFRSNVGTEESLKNENICTALAAIESNRLTMALSKDPEQVKYAEEDYRQIEQLMMKAYDVRGYRSPQQKETPKEKTNKMKL